MRMDERGKKLKIGEMEGELRRERQEEREEAGEEGGEERVERYGNVIGMIMERSEAPQSCIDVALSRHHSKTRTARQSFNFNLLQNSNDVTFDPVTHTLVWKKDHDLPQVDDDVGISSPTVSISDGKEEIAEKEKEIERVEEGEGAPRTNEWKESSQRMYKRSKSHVSIRPLPLHEPRYAGGEGGVLN